MKDLCIELVIFDMDGLMFDTERLYFNAWKKAASRYGYDFSEDVFKETLGINHRDTSSIFKKHYGEDFPISIIRSERIKLVEEYVNTYGVPVKDGLYDLLDFLKANNFKRAVATSTSRGNALFMLKAAKVDGFFDYIVCGDDIKNSKPDPEIFLKVARSLNCAPKRCIVLEDSEAGVIAANRGGMLPIMIPDMKEPSSEIQKLLYKQFESLNDVKLMLEDVLAA